MPIAELDKQAAELKEQTEALAKVRRQMIALGVADNDVLDLNVGGVPMSVKRATLTQVDLLQNLTPCCCQQAMQHKLLLKALSLGSFVVCARCL